MTGSSTLMLPLLLLPLVIAFRVSAPAPCPGMHELQSRLNKLKESVKVCGNCSSADITDKCKCLNLTAHIERFPDYFSNGLESLNRSGYSMTDIKPIITKLKRCQINSTSVSVQYDPVISPADLVQKLQVLTQQINSLQSQTTSNRR